MRQPWGVAELRQTQERADRNARIVTGCWKEPCSPAIRLARGKLRGQGNVALLPNHANPENALAPFTRTYQPTAVARLDNRLVAGIRLSR